MSETIFDDKDSGLRQAAKELSDAREQGLPISSPEPEPRELPEAPPPIVARAYDDLKATPDRERPILELGVDKGVPIRAAADAISKWRNERSEGEEEIQRKLDSYTADQAREFLEDHPEVQQRILDDIEKQERVTTALEETRETIEERLKQVEQENAQRKAENERLRADREAASMRKAIQENANEVQQYQAQLHESFYQTFPEAERFLRHGDPRAMQELAVLNPARYAEIVQTGLIVDDMITGRASRVNAQKMVVAQNEMNKVTAAHSEYQGENGTARLQRDIDAGIRARMESSGKSRAEVLADIEAHPENLTVDTIEDFLARGRQHRARQEIKNGRRNYAPPVPQRPGVSRDPGSHRHGLLTTLADKANKTQTAKDWGKWLSAARRESNR